MLIATPHVSDQSLLLVAHRGERRCDDAFWLLVSRPTASQCSRPFRFHFWRWSLCLNVLLAKFSDDHTVLRRRRWVRRLLTYRSFHELVFVISMDRQRLQRLSLR